MSLSPDYDTLVRAFRWALPTPDSVCEVRALSTYRGRGSIGYFNDPVLAANAVCALDHEGIGGIYATLNPVLPDLLYRAQNRFVAMSNGMGTKDTEILSRRELLLDFDPKRPSGISSTDEEHEASLKHADEVSDILVKEFGWPQGALIDSGNGGHLRYILEHLPNDALIQDTIKRVVHAAHATYSTETVELDKTVFNASRICRLPGTIARKGENVPRRPHRMARILRDFDAFKVLTLEAMEGFLDTHGSAPVPVPVQPSGSRPHEYPADEALYRKLNSTARERLHDWVPELLGHIARPSGDGYRITSEDLGRELEEDISIMPSGGIKDFGVHDLGDPTEGRRTPVSLIAEFVTNGDKREAAEKLSLILNVPVNEFIGQLLAPLPISGEPVTMPASLLGTTDLARPTRWSEVFHDPIDEVTFLIDGLIVHNTHTVLSGPPKAGKSTLMYKMALHALHGRPVFGRRMDACNVLYLAIEDREKRLKRKLRKQLDSLRRNAWKDMTDAEAEEASHHLQFYTLTSKTKDGTPKRLPIGLEGANEIRRIISEDTSRPWLIVIEPVLLFHQEGSTRNLNKQEYEQIDIINSIIDEEAYNCSIVSIKHDRKLPPGGIKGVVNLMDNIAGSVAQQGAPDAQIQFYGKNFYNYDGLSWLMVQSRDFGKLQVPLVSDGEVWDSPPKDMEVPSFEEYMEQSVEEERGRRLQDPNIDNKLVTELAKNTEGLTTTALSRILNISDQIIRRRFKTLLDEGRVIVIGRTDTGITLYGVPGPASMPNSNLRDVI